MIVSGVRSQTNSSDTCCIKKAHARKAIEANRENKLLKEERKILIQKIDTCESIISDYNSIVKQQQEAIDLNIQLREIANTQATAYKAEAIQNNKKAKRYKRQRNAIGIGGVLSIIAIIIFI